MNQSLEPLEARRLLSATISGVIYQDIGAVGSFQSGDPGLAGWTVYLDLNHDSKPDPSDPSAVTDASGRYTIANVPAGTYQVRENPVTGFQPIPSAYQTVTVADGQALANVDIGNQNLVDFTYPGLTAAQDSVNNFASTTPTNPPNSTIAVSNKFLITVNNNSISTYRRTDGTQISTESLAEFFENAPIDYPQPNAANATDAEVFFNVGTGRFFIAAIANTSTGSELLVAASQKSDPTMGVWRYHSIDVQTTTGQAVFASNLSVSFNGSAIYLAANINDATGNFVGSRLWIANRGKVFGLTSNVITKYVFIYDPSTAAGLSSDLADIDAANFSGKSISNVGVAYFVAGTPATAGNIADVIEVRHPGNKAAFSLHTLATPADIAISATAPPPAAQPDGAPSIDTASNAVSATWRHTYFWVAETLVPATGPDAGTAQVYWFEYNLPNYALLGNGSISGSSISAGASTFAPSIGVDRDQYMALSFSASGSSLDPGVYAVSRRTPDPAGYTRPPLTINAGEAPYSATTESSGLVDWGINEMVLDPTTQERFWTFAHAATDPASPAGPWSQVMVGFGIPPKKFPVKNT